LGQLPGLAFAIVSDQIVLRALMESSLLVKEPFENGTKPHDLLRRANRIQSQESVLGKGLDGFLG
jgi:hypothetical protein